MITTLSNSPTTRGVRSLARDLCPLDYFGSFESTPAHSMMAETPRRNQQKKKLSLSTRCRHPLLAGVFVFFLFCSGISSHVNTIIGEERKRERGEGLSCTLDQFGRLKAIPNHCMMVKTPNPKQGSRSSSTIMNWHNGVFCSRMYSHVKRKKEENKDARMKSLSPSPPARGRTPPPIRREDNTQDDNT